MTDSGSLEESRRMEYERGKGKQIWDIDTEVDKLSNEKEKKDQKQVHITENLIYESLGIKDQKGTYKIHSGWIVDLKIEIKAFRKNI